MTNDSIEVLRFQFNEENLQKIRKVGERLLGSCRDLDGALQEEFGEDADLMDFDTALLHELDDHTMCCEACGWWCESSDLNDDQVCGDCESES